MKEVDMKPTERFVERLEYLLLRHNCVIIPDWGGFVLHSEPVLYDADEHAFTPKRINITFDSTLTYNDGLLADAYMQAFATDHDEAQQLANHDIAAAKEQLDDDAELSLGAIGIFIKSNDRIIFIQGRHSGEKFSVEAYGLPVFHYFPLTSRKKTAIVAEITEDKVTVSLPDTSTVPATDAIATTGVHLPATLSSTASPDSSNRRKPNPIMRICLHTAAAAAIIVLFLLVSTPVSDVNKSSYSAGLIPKDLIKSSFENNAPKIAVSPFSTDTAAKTETAGNVAPSSQNTPTDSHVAVKNDKNNSPVNQANTITETERKYYVIIGSFQTRKQAQSFIRRLKNPESETADIIVYDSRVRVFAQSFSLEEPALAYMKKIRQKPGYEQAWIFKDPRKKAQKR